MHAAGNACSGRLIVLVGLFSSAGLGGFDYDVDDDARCQSRISERPLHATSAPIRSTTGRGRGGRGGRSLPGVPAGRCRTLRGRHLGPRDLCPMRVRGGRSN